MPKLLPLSTSRTPAASFIRITTPVAARTLSPDSPSAEAMPPTTSTTHTASGAASAVKGGTRPPAVGTSRGGYDISELLSPVPVHCPPIHLLLQDLPTHPHALHAEPSAVPLPANTQHEPLSSLDVSAARPSAPITPDHGVVPVANAKHRTRVPSLLQSPKPFPPCKTAARDGSKRALPVTAGYTALGHATTSKVPAAMGDIGYASHQPPDDALSAMLSEKHEQVRKLNVVILKNDARLASIKTLPRTAYDVLDAKMAAHAQQGAGRSTARSGAFIGDRRTRSPPPPTSST